jgi:pyruvate dehydrogenase E2 component (dihydrolipoamide acetyltransferase)
MPVPFIIPKMDMDQENVVIAQWLKKEGDYVNKGEVVILVETDKITSEVEAPASGQLTHLLYQESETAPVTKVVAYILEEGETINDLLQQSKQQAATQEETVKVDLPSTEKPCGASPLAKHMAEVEGINLDEIKPVGDKITKQDVENYLRNRNQPNPRVEIPATPAARRLAKDENIDLKRITGTGPRSRVQAADVKNYAGAYQKQKSASVKGLRSSKTQELSTMRRIIAERLTASYQNTPHIFLSVDVDMSSFETARKKINEDFQKSRLQKVSVTALLIKILAQMLKNHPHLNASIENQTIKFWDDVNIGIATSLESGLIVPVIYQADRMSLNDLNHRIKYLSERAREGRLSLDEIQGGTFTVSNMGMYGITSFTSIINPPQSAILSVGEIKRQLVVIDEEDSINIRPILNLTLGADHRIIDGAVAANFLKDLVDSLENPEEIG